MVKLLQSSDDICVQLHEIIYNMLNNIINSIELPTSWNYLPILNKRSVYNYVGIKNLGAICYMISMI